jgi:2-keto-4-pentenoate hydratase
MAGIDVEAVVESVWQSMGRGVYYPPEWQGKLSTDEAYRVQLGILQRYLDQGETQAGWKVGLTAKAIQDQVGVHEPVFGFLLRSGGRGSGVVFLYDDLIDPGVENELCVTVGTALQGPGVTVVQARAALTAAAPALEIIERRGDFRADLNLSFVDNCQQKHWVTGTTVPLDPATRLAESTVEIWLNGQSQEHARGAAVLDEGPAASVAWLANKLAAFGRRIEPGMRIMSGSYTRQYTPLRGDRIEARFSPFGPVTATFA